MTQYRNITSGGREQGTSATIGLENASGTIAFQYAANEAAIAEGVSIRYATTPSSGPYDQTVNAGGPGYASGSGVYWSPDRQYTLNSWGYTNTSSTISETRKTIAGTADVTVYRTQRVSPAEYRFDGLTPGTYQVTVGFAEFRKVKRGARVADIVAEGTTVLPAHDVMAHAAIYTADAHTFTIAVNDGQLNLLFVPRPGSQPAIVNAIRVVKQP